MYLNVDTGVAGNYLLTMGSSPLVKDMLRDFSKMVEDPGAHDDKTSIYDIMAERNPSDPAMDPPKPAVGSLGSGSDYAAFFQFVGVPSADFIYMGYNNTKVFYPVYHTQHDTFEWLTKFIDPDFKYHKAQAQFCGLLLLAFADMPLLKMNAMLYSEALEDSFKSLKAEYNIELKKHKGTLELLEDSIKKFSETAAKFTEAQ